MIEDAGGSAEESPVAMSADDDLLGGGAAEQSMAEKERERRLLSQLSNEFLWYKREREAIMDPTWNECYRLYKAQAPNPRKSGDWRSRVHVPYAFVNVEDVVPHLMAGVFDADQPFKVTSRQAPDLAEAHERLALYQWNEEMNMEIVWEEVQKMKAIFGTAPYYTGFKAVFEDRKTWRTIQGPDGSEIPVIGVDTGVPVYVGNFVEPLHLFRVYVHPEATITEPKKVYWVQYRTMGWLEEQAKYKNLDKLTTDKRHQGGSADETVWGGIDEFGSMHSSYPGGGSADTNPTYRVITCYDDENRLVYTMAGPQNSEVLIEEGHYPFWHNKCPIQFDRYTIVPREFYGTGMIEPSISLMHEANLIRNQRRDNVSLAMNMIFEIKENAIDDEEAELVSRPGAIIHSQTGDAIRPIQYPDVTSGAFAEERMVSSDIKDQSGLGAALTGGTDPNSPSGTKYSLQQKAGMLRLSRAIRREAICIKDIATMMVSNNDQFYPVKCIKEILGPVMFPSYEQVLPSTVTLRALIQCQPVGLFANEDVLRQQFANFMNIIVNQPLFMQEMDAKGILKVGLKQFSNLIGDPEKVMRKGMNVDAMEHQMAVTENFAIAQGQPVPPAAPSQEHEIHEAHHQQLLSTRPDMFMATMQHIQSHRMAKQMGDMLAMQGAGGGGSPVNPARQPKPTSQEGVIRGGARQMGRTMK